MNLVTFQQDQQNFNSAYRASQPPAIRQMMSIADAGMRTQRAQELALSGYIIDAPIMVWGGDPYVTMALREEYGYTWVPNAMQAPLPIAPRLNTPNVPVYDPNKPPAGSIFVSTNPAAFPEWVDPTPVAPAPSPKFTSDYIGPLAGFGWNYSVLPGDPTPDAKVVEHAGNENAPPGFYMKHTSSTLSPFGMMKTEWYQKVENVAAAPAPVPAAKEVK